MELVGKFFMLYPQLLKVVLQCAPFVFLIASLFVIKMAINMACLFFWGRY